MNILVLGTIHKEIGKCNVQNLYKILEEINPDLIFEEMEPKYFANYYINHTSSKLESIAISKYLENKDILHIPVDSNNIPEEKFGDAMYTIYDSISILSSDFKPITRKFNSHSYKRGFQYLNSIEFSNDLSNKNKIIEEEFESYKNDSLKDLYSFYKNVNSKREEEMLDNIYEFSKQSNFKNAVFIVGADHCNSFTTRIEQYQKKVDITLNWHFYNRDDVMITK